MGRAAAASAQPTNPFAVNEDRALAELELEWDLGDLMDELDTIYPDSSEQITG